MLQNPLIADIGARLGKSVAQVVLRWQLQHGALPIPKSSNSERQRQNLAVFDFELSADDMAAIATLAKPDGRSAGRIRRCMKSFNDKGSRPSEIKLHSQQAFQTAFFQTAEAFGNALFIACAGAADIVKCRKRGTKLPTATAPPPEGNRLG